MAVWLGVFCAVPVCPCAANVITSVGECAPELTDFTAGRRFSNSGPSSSVPGIDLTTPTRTAEFREDAIGLAAGFLNDGESLIVFPVQSFDQLLSKFETSDAIRHLEWQMTRTGGLAAYKAYEVGSTGDLSITQTPDTLEYENSVARGSLRARQIIPKLSEFSTSQYFTPHEESPQPGNSGSRRRETRVGEARGEGQRL